MPEGLLKFDYMLEHPIEPKVLIMQKSLGLGNQQRSLENDLSWLGGIIDGEGMITVMGRSERNRKNKSFIPRISIVNTNPIMITDCVSILKSINVPHYIQTKKGKGTWKTKIEIIIGGYKRVSHALPILIPYIRTKKEQSLLLMELCKSRMTNNSNSPYSDNDYQLANRIRKYNRMGSSVDSLILPETTRRTESQDSDDIVRPFAKA